MSMIRKIVSLILVPFVLLTQSVTFGHSHTGNQPVGHGLRNHIHVNLTAANEEHEHAHPHGTHSHNHQNDSYSDRDKPVSDQMESLFDHDSSAVFLNSTDLTSGSRSNIYLEIMVLCQWNLPGTDLSADTLATSGPQWHLHGCAPPDPDSSLFIRHHAILI